MLQTVDVVVILEEAEETADVVVVSEAIAACGSSFCLSSAADAATTLATTDADAAMTVVCGSSFCLSSAADAAMDAATSIADADANLLKYRPAESATGSSAGCIQPKGDGVYHSVLFIL